MDEGKNRGKDGVGDEGKDRRKGHIEWDQSREGPLRANQAGA